MLNGYAGHTDARMINAWCLLRTSYTLMHLIGTDNGNMSLKHENHKKVPLNFESHWMIYFIEPGAIIIAGNNFNILGPKQMTDISQTTFLN